MSTDIKPKRKLRDINEILDPKYGEIGTPERKKFTDEAIALYYGEILKEKRLEKHLTQEELAAKVGLKRNFISRVEQGKSDMRISTFVRIARALDLKTIL